MRIFLSLLALIIFVSMTPIQAQEAQPYLLRSGDRLAVKVFGHPELSSPDNLEYSSHIVSPDGKISFELIGAIEITGKTIDEVREELEERYKKFLRNPSVTVNLIELGTTRVCVLGEVQKQGLYELKKNHRLVDALAAANGFVAKSSKKNIFVIRAGEQEPCLVVNLNDLLTKGDKTKNIELNEGDCVYISSNHKIVFSRDILPFLNGIYYVDHIG